MLAETPFSAIPQIQLEPRVSRSEAASSKRLVRMVPGSARNWIAVNAGSIIQSGETESFILWKRKLQLWEVRSTVENTLQRDLLECRRYSARCFALPGCLRVREKPSPKCLKGSF